MPKSADMESKQTRPASAGVLGSCFYKTHTMYIKKYKTVDSVILNVPFCPLVSKFASLDTAANMSLVRIVDQPRSRYKILIPLRTYSCYDVIKKNQDAGSSKLVRVDFRRKTGVCEFNRV